MVGGMSSLGRLGEEKRLGQVRAGTIPRLWGEIWAFRRPMAAVSALTVVAALATLGGPYLLKVGIDDHVRAGNRAGLAWVATLYLAVYLGHWAANYWQTYLTTWVGQQVVHGLRVRLFGRLQGLSLRYFEGQPTGAVMARVIQDVDALSQFVGGGLSSLIADGLAIGGIVAVMFYLHARLAAVALLVAPLLYLVVRFFTARLRGAFQRQRRRVAEINANLQESISGMRVTQAFVREDENLARFEDLNQRSVQANLTAVGWFALFMPAVDLVGAAGTAAVLWYGGAALIEQRAGITVGVLAAFLAYLSRLFMPIRDLSQFYNLLQAAVVASERVYELLDRTPEVFDLPGARELPPVRGHVRFEGVTFGYVAGRPVLHDVHLEARPGEMVALVGPTGAGKTSVVNLLARFYDPQAGRVSIDGVDIRTVTLRSLRSQIGLVPQDTFIFSGSVADNIRFGRPGATDVEVEEAARAVGIHDFICRLPEGYATQVQERGATLSSGQRQLIAFARALLARPAILILDEATAMVDAASEALVAAAVDRLLAGRTAFVIAHRLSTVRRADRIYVLDAGRVVEQGRHDELVAAGGRYARLYAEQARGLMGAAAAGV